MGTPFGQQDTCNMVWLCQLENAVRGWHVSASRTERGLTAAALRRKAGCLCPEPKAQAAGL